MTVIYEVPANHLQKAKEGHNDWVSEYADRHKRFSSWCTVDEGVRRSHVKREVATNRRIDERRDLARDRQSKVVTINETKTSVASGVVMLISPFLRHHECVSDCFWTGLTKKSHVLKRSVVSPMFYLRLYCSYWRTYLYVYRQYDYDGSGCSLLQDRSRNELGSVYGTIAATIIYSLWPKLILLQNFSNHQDTTTFGGLSVVMAGIGMPAAFAIWGSWFRLVAYISPITGCNSRLTFKRSSHQSGLFLRWQGSTSLQEATDQSSMCKINRKILATSSYGIVFIVVTIAAPDWAYCLNSFQAFNWR